MLDRAFVLLVALFFGGVRAFEVFILNDYKTFKQTTGTMIPLVYVGSIVI